MCKKPYIVVHTSYIVLLLLLFCVSGYAQPLSSTELINNARQYDGKAVIYAGEVIGEVMVRGQYAWINVHDGQTAIGVWVAKNLIQDILYTGSYKARGDRIEISGVFQHICPEHGGDLDIHASSITKLKSGENIFEALSRGKINFALLLSALAVLLWILQRLIKK